MKMFTSQGNFSNDIKNLIKQRKNDEVKSYIGKLAPSDLIDSKQMSLLYLAAKYNNCDLTKHLIKIKCNVNAKNNSKTTPLMVAAISNSFKTAQILIQANADINATNSSNKSALQLLLSNNRIPRYLIRCCFNKVRSGSSSDEEFAAKLFMANCRLSHVIHLEEPSVTRMVLNHYDKIDPQQTQPALDLAFKLNDQENIYELLQFMLEIKISNIYAIQFLHKICTTRDEIVDLKFIKSIIEKVTDWNSLEKEGMYWLNKIFLEGSKEVIKLFLDLNINDYVRNQIPGHDLIINLFANSQAGVKEMLDYLKFDINSHGQKGFTALHFAVRQRESAGVKTVVNMGANPNIRDYEGHVPLTYVCTYPIGYIYDSEEEERSDNSDDDENRNPDKNSEARKIIEVLLHAGADPQLDTCSMAYGHSWYNSFGITKQHMMLAQLAIDESKGIQILETIRQDINASPKVLTLYEECCQQLETMKATTVHGSITLYTVMVAEVEKTANRLHNQEILREILQSNETDQLNFYYESKLKYSVTKILHIMDLKIKASSFICETTGLLASQYLILEKILSYLSYKDLLVFE